MGSTSGESSCQKDGLSSLYLEILHSDSFGRYLVAKEDIPEKTLILSEIPVVFGPTDDKNLKTNVVSLYCVACCKFLYPLPNHHKNGVPQEEILNRLWYCSTCGFPVCDKQCEKVIVINLSSFFLKHLTFFTVILFSFFSVCNSFRK